MTEGMPNDFIKHVVLKLAADSGLKKHAFWFADYLAAFLCENSLAHLKELYVL